MENDPTYSDEQRQFYKDRLDDLNAEKQVRLEILSQNQKDLQTQVASIKQILKKVLDKNTFLAEKIRNLFRELGITMFRYWLPFQWLFQRLYLLLLVSLWKVEGQEALHQNMKGFEKMVRQASRCTQKTCRKGCLGIACYRGKCCWCHFKFFWQGR